jgi:ribosome biogenesis GTPase
VESLPIAEVIQVHSVYVEVMLGEQRYLAVGRRTQQRGGHAAIVGDLVRLRATGTSHESGLPEAVIEHVLPRQTLLGRQDSFHKERFDPIVANAQQMLIVASILQPRVKWGLVDRMLIAAEAGGLKPIVCVNKIDLAGDEERADVDAVLGHYATMGIQTLQSSVPQNRGMAELQQLLADRRTVLAGHSGVGKSSLIRGVAPDLDIRIGDVSTFNEKGRHTTTSSRRYPLPFGGYVIDTPGVRQFGLMNVTEESLIAFFPDVEEDTAPEWRQESYQRILESL